MAQDGLLSPTAQAQLKEIEQADLLVGIPSYNNARTIGHVVRAAGVGLAKYFPQVRAVIVNSDGGSTDGTPEVVAQAALDDLQAVLVRHPVTQAHRIVTPYLGIPGKGSALRTIFGIAEALGVKACCVVDSDLRSITPEWIELLLRPVWEGEADYVTPLYSRHKFDGTITNSIVYPLTRALYGQRIRQPIGGDFGFSGKLAARYLEKPVWETDVARFGVDIWMTITALAEGFRVCQAYLGAKIHDAKDPGADLSAMLVQVVGSLFELMETYAEVWFPVSASIPVPVFGFHYHVGLEPIQVSVDRMLAIFRQGVRDLDPIWTQILEPPVFEEIQTLAAEPRESFRFPDLLWVRTIYSFALAHHRRLLHREHLLKSLTPLYLGRTAGFFLAYWDAGAAEVEEAIERLALTFETEKPSLVEAWRLKP